MIKTKKTGVRIPLLLWELVKVSNPGKSFSRCVIDCLEKEYNLNPKFYDRCLFDIEKEIDIIDR